MSVAIRMSRNGRRWTILVHRYVGAALSLMFAVWFVSGITMVYTGGMPALSEDARLGHMAPLDFASVRITARDAAIRAGSMGRPGRIFLLTILDRPAYRFSGEPTITVFADTGETLTSLGAADSIAVASTFAAVPPSRVHYIRTLNAPDQWTVGQRLSMPLHELAVDDQAHTELYVSDRLGEVVMRTTRSERSLAWVAAIPHWLYLTPLRARSGLWTFVVLTVSALGAVVASAGLLLAVLQFRVRYGGLTRLHHATGLCVGVFALTWVVSGLLSLEPGHWASRGHPAHDIEQALAGGPVDLSMFPRIDAAAWQHVPGAGSIKVLELCRLQGEPYYVAVGGSLPTASTMVSMVIATKTNRLRSTRIQGALSGEGFSAESIIARSRTGFPTAHVVESTRLSDYDAYYYDRDRRKALPVLRVKFSDPERLWVYVNLQTGQLIADITRRQRLERWLYHGLHSLDFPFWYYRRPLWDIVIVVLCLGGALSSGLGVAMAMKRLLCKL